MASENQEKPRRTQADKERSRQQSRAVSGKEAAKGVQGKPGQGQRSPTQASGKSSKGPRSGGSGQGGGRRPPNKGGSGRGGAGRPPRRSNAALYTWGVVGLVILLVVILVIVKVTSSSSTSGPQAPAKPVTAAIAAQVTQIPESVYNTVGVSSPNVPVAAPHKISGQKPLMFDGKPGVFYMGGEFCPYCAAERWSLIAALSRFGKLTGLQTMESSSTDVYPNTQTFTFYKATFTSPYIGTQLVEYYSNQPTSTGNGHKILTPLTKTQRTLVTTYDTAKYTGGSSTASGSIPFIDFGNKFIASGSSYRPTVLQSLSRAQIAGGLSDASNSVTQAIVASANYQSAAICSIDGSKPSIVCSGKGVQAAAKTMGIKV
ncbi:MAG: DUF929 family protein [Acidimicrobiales bacterium]